MGMRKWVGAMGAVMGIAITGFAIGLCEYTSPTTELLKGKVSFFYQHADDPTTPSVDVSSGWLAFEARRQYDSATRGFTVGGSGELRFQGLGLAQATVAANGALRQYMTTSLPLFTFGGIEAALDTAFPQPRVEAQAGLGYGRFYNVTPLVKAEQIREQLLAMTAFPVALTDDQTKAMAREIGKQVEGEDPAERAAAVAALIEGQLGRKLDPAAVLMIEQTLAATGRERYCGWTVQAGLAYEVVDPKGGLRDFLFSLALDAAVPTEANAQLLLKARIVGPYWITEQHTLSLEASFETELRDEIRFSARYSLFQDKPRGQLPAGRQAASFHLEITLGWVGVTLQMEFSKLAETPTWKQSIVITATARLW